MTKIGEKVSKAYLYNDRVFESYDDASRAYSEDGHIDSSREDCIDEIDFVRSAQVGNEKLEGNEMTEAALKEQHEAELREAFEAGAEGRLIVHDYEERETTWLAPDMTGVRYVMRYETFEDYQNQKKEGGHDKNKT